MIRRTMPVRVVAGESCPRLRDSRRDGSAITNPGKRKDDSSLFDAAAGLVALWNCLGGIAFGNEARHGPAGSLHLHGPLDANPARAYRHIRRTPHRLSGLSAFSRLGGGKVSQLRSPEREAGGV